MPHEATNAPDGPPRVVVLPADLRHRRDELRVRQPDEKDEQPADDESDDRPEAPGIEQPRAGQNDPPEADHGPERQRQHVHAPEYPNEALVVVRPAHDSPSRNYSSSRFLFRTAPDFPMLRIEPAHPMLKMEPALPMLRIEPELPMLMRLPKLPTLRTEPALATLNMLATLNRLPTLTALHGLRERPFFLIALLSPRIIRARETPGEPSARRTATPEIPPASSEGRRGS
jgi:hypothetical protein